MLQVPLMLIPILDVLVRFFPLFCVMRILFFSLVL